MLRFKMHIFANICKVLRDKMILNTAECVIRCFRERIVKSDWPNTKIFFGLSRDYA